MLPVAGGQPGHRPQLSELSEPDSELATPGKAGEVRLDVGPLGICDSADLAFTDLRYRVPALKGGKVEVLKGVSGACRSGRVVALMGASGAGKTSLIDILAGHVRAGVCGKVTVNGLPFKAADFQKRSCYVPQRDVLLSTATVREAITTSALLRLPQSMSRAEKLERVQQVIQQLELEACADTLIGDELEGVKGISGGERRRVSVAIGLVTDPQIILLDEPTSGLDSETAAQLVHCLVRLARCNRTVITSIHQPSSNITACFDDLMLLAGGRCIYFGPWQASMAHFAKAGWPCPLYSNPADHYLAIAKEAGGLLAKKWAAARSWEAEYLAEPFAARGTPKQPLTSRPSTPKQQITTRPGTPYSAERGHGHSRSVSFAESDSYIRAGGVSTSLGEERQASACGTPISPGGVSTVSAAESCKEAPIEPRPATSWLFAMRVLLVRFVRNWCRKPTLLYSFLAQYTFAGIFMGLMYFQLGTTRGSSIFDRQASLFLVLVMLAFTPSNTACSVFVAVAVIFQMISESLGCICAILTRTASIGLLLSTTVMMVLFPFSGFLINYTPVFFRWLSKVSFVTYAYSAILGGSQFSCLPTAQLSRTRGPGGNDLTIAQNIAVLIGFLVGLRVVAFAALQAAYKLKRL